MAMTATQPILSERGAAVERHWQELAAKRRMYTGLGAVILIMAVTGSLWFANETNSGKFFDSVPQVCERLERTGQLRNSLAKGTIDLANAFIKVRRVTARRIGDLLKRGSE